MLFCVVELFTHLECHSHLHLQSTRDIAPLIRALSRGFQHFKMPSGQVSSERELVKCKPIKCDPAWKLFIIPNTWPSASVYSKRWVLGQMCRFKSNLKLRWAKADPRVGFQVFGPTLHVTRAYTVCIWWTVAGIVPDLKASKGISSMAVSNCIFAFITIDLGFLAF